MRRITCTMVAAILLATTLSTAHADDTKGQMVASVNLRIKQAAAPTADEITARNALPNPERDSKKKTIYMAVGFTAAAVVIGAVATGLALGLKPAGSTQPAQEAR